MRVFERRPRLAPVVHEHLRVPNGVDAGRGPRAGRASPPSPDRPAGRRSRADRRRGQATAPAPRGARSPAPAPRPGRARRPSSASCRRRPDRGWARSSPTIDRRGRRPRAPAASPPRCRGRTGRAGAGPASTGRWRWSRSAGRAARSRAIITHRPVERVQPELPHQVASPCTGETYRCASCPGRTAIDRHVRRAVVVERLDRPSPTTGRRVRARPRRPCASSWSGVTIADAPGPQSGAGLAELDVLAVDHLFVVGPGSADGEHDAVGARSGRPRPHRRSRRCDSAGTNASITSRPLRSESPGDAGQAAGLGGLGGEVEERVERREHEPKARVPGLAAHTASSRWPTSAMSAVDDADAVAARLADAAVRAWPATRRAPRPRNRARPEGSPAGRCRHRVRAAVRPASDRPRAGPDGRPRPGGHRRRRTTRRRRRRSCRRRSPARTRPRPTSLPHAPSGPRGLS